MYCNTQIRNDKILTCGKQGELSLFWFKDEITRRKEKEEYEKLMEEVKNKEKPTFKDLVAIMIAQYAIILPMVFGGLIIFAIILYILMAWLK